MTFYKTETKHKLSESVPYIVMSVSIFDSHVKLLYKGGKAAADLVGMELP